MASPMFPPATVDIALAGGIGSQRGTHAKNNSKREQYTPKLSHCSSFQGKTKAQPKLCLLPWYLSHDADFISVLIHIIEIFTLIFPCIGDMIETRQAAAGVGRGLFRGRRYIIVVLAAQESLRPGSHPAFWWGPSVPPLYIPA